MRFKVKGIHLFGFVLTTKKELENTPISFYKEDCIRFFRKYREVKDKTRVKINTIKSINSK